VSTTTLAAMTLRTEDELFAARQGARECALELGVDSLDALRVATAVSELGREVVFAGGGTVVIRLDEVTLEVEVRADRLPEQWGDALAAAGRLVDEALELSATELAAIEPGGSGASSASGAGPAAGVVLTKTVPSSPTPRELAALRDRLLALVPATPGEELRRQNQELLTALEEVRAQRAELQVVNEELETTNKGVLALYHELSAELDRTNQGVVALYAEIDDKNLQLREASEAKSRFLRSISHELRTPTNSVLGLTGLLLDPRQVDRLTAEQTEQVEFIRASAGDLLRLVEELLDLAKAESGRLVPTLSEVRLPELLLELAGITEPLLRPGVTLRTETGGVDVLRTDPDLLRHVLRNLLSNAAKFTAEGEVVLSATTGGEDEEYVDLAVRDTGLGIAPEDLTRIFEEFFQAPSPLQASVRGTGLGLPFAQVVAGALGGHIEVESTLGEGSTFRLRLPRSGPIPEDWGAGSDRGDGGTRV
jgi:signal transduction histidine kinase